MNVSAVKDGTVTRPHGLSTIQTELSSLEKELKNKNQMDNLKLNKIKTRLEANQDLMRSALKKSTDLKVGGAIVGWDGMGWDGMFNV